MNACKLFLGLLDSRAMPWGRKFTDWDPQFSFALLLDKLGDIGREESYLIVACTVITEVPEAVGP